jgi:hypothetical protein
LKGDNKYDEDEEEEDEVVLGGVYVEALETDPPLMVAPNVESRPEKLGMLTEILAQLN